MNNYIIAIIAVAIAVVAIAASNAQTNDTTGPMVPCQEAATWHLHQALRFSQHDDQTYHLQAANAAMQLKDLGDNCDGWKDDAMRPGLNGDGTATQADQIQAATKVQP